MGLRVATRVWLLRERAEWQVTLPEFHAHLPGFAAILGIRGPMTADFGARWLTSDGHVPLAMLIQDTLIAHPGRAEPEAKGERGEQESLHHATRSSG
jgi:hypothetical protein